jgi:3(or 17)beta-hydroxysteroid dehydrogenase
MQMGRLSGKVAIITGGSMGLGEADVRLFAEQGAQVIISDINEAAGEALAQEIGASARFMRHDVSNEAEWIALIDTVMADYGRLDILVNNAGVVKMGSIESQTTDEYRFMMSVMADGTYFGCKHAVPAMRKSGGGSIVNISSIASVQGEAYVFGYSAAKGAIESMTRSIAVHCGLAGYNIRCNSVHPSGTLTPMVMGVGAVMADPEEVKRLGLEGTNAPMSKLAEPMDIANLVLFLASDESRFVNGAAYRIDNAMSVIPGTVPA